MSSPVNNFSKMLRVLLKAQGYTQADLAKYVGVAPQTISLYCKGKTTPEYDNLIRIAEFLNVNIHYLITREILTREKYDELMNEQINNLTEENERLNVQLANMKSGLRRILYGGNYEA